MRFGQLKPPYSSIAFYLLATARAPAPVNEINHVRGVVPQPLALGAPPYARKEEIVAVGSRANTSLVPAPTRKRIVPSSKGQSAGSTGIWAAAISSRAC